MPLDMNIHDLFVHWIFNVIDEFCVGSYSSIYNVFINLHEILLKISQTLISEHKFAQYMSHHMSKTRRSYGCPVKTQISLDIHPDWSQSSLSAWGNYGSLASRKAHSEHSDQTGGCPDWSESSLGAQVILLVLSYCRSYVFKTTCRNDPYC